MAGGRIGVGTGLIPDGLAGIDRRTLLAGSAGLWMAGLLPGCAQPLREPSRTAEAPTAIPTAHESAAPAADSPELARTVDAQLSPHQFSLDLGFVPDGDLHAYVEQVARTLSVPQPPGLMAGCTCRVLNAHHLNAYIFPGGSIGLTRGLLLELQDEAELAAVLAHQSAHLQLGHVGRQLRHADIRSRLLATTLGISQESAWAPLIGLDTPLGGSPLLARFSLADEAAADRATAQLLVRAGYQAQAWPRLLERLHARSRSAPVLLAAMGTSHPFDAGRLQAAYQAADQAARQAAKQAARPDARQDSQPARDRGAGNDGIPAAAGARPDPGRWRREAAWWQGRGTIVSACQSGEQAMLAQQPADAQAHFERAVRSDPQDYGAQVRLAQCLQMQGHFRAALSAAEMARQSHPKEAQAHRLAASLQLSLRDAAKAWLALEQYDRLLPGDPGALFLQGVALEALGRTRLAAEYFRTYLRLTHEGQAAQYATNHLKGLGYAP